MIPVLLIGHFQGHFINAPHSHTTPIHPHTLASGANSEQEIALKSRAMMVDHVLWTDRREANNWLVHPPSNAGQA